MSQTRMFFDAFTALADPFRKFPLPGCLKHQHQNSQFKCLIPAVTIKFVSIPLFLA